MADTLPLGGSAVRHGGSSPLPPKKVITMTGLINNLNSTHITCSVLGLNGNII